MSEVKESPIRHSERTIVVDGKFLREQAREAVETFFAPLAGVYAAAKGERIAFRRDRPRKARRSA